MIHPFIMCLNRDTNISHIYCGIKLVVQNSSKAKKSSSLEVIEKRNRISGTDIGTLIDTTSAITTVVSN